MRRRHEKADLSVRALRLMLLISIVVLFVGLLPSLAERDWGSILFGVLLVGVLAFWYGLLKRRS